MNRRALFRIAAVSLFCCLCQAASLPVDVDHSSLKIRVYKSGFFSGFAHDHEIAVPLSSGTVDATALSVEVHFDARKMTVLDPDASPSDRAKVQETMLSDTVLDAHRFPEIGFVSRSVKPSGENAYSVEGDLTLHGVTHSITVPVALAGGHYTGSVKLKQTDFGIVPIKLFGGSVKVKDVVEIGFDIVAR
jgi:polyisoprenoid-binding protein YceI